MAVVASIAAWQRPLAATLVVVLLALLLYSAWRCGRLRISFLAVAPVIAAAWLLARAAVRTDYRDADGYVDCWPSCTLLQDSVGLAIWYGPVLLIALGVVAAVLAAITGPPSGREEPDTRPTEHGRA